MDRKFRLNGVPPAKPILKWAGSKQQLLSKIWEYLPKNYGRYFEPFFGGGSVFFELNPTGAYVSDCNYELISTYTSIRDFPEKVIDELGNFHQTEEEYYKVRGIDPYSLPGYKLAARMIYLNKTCFNGLYRVNKNGEFNSSYGHNRKKIGINSDNIRGVSNTLRRNTIVCGDYRGIAGIVKPGDLIFLDPPYTSISKTSDFNRYNATKFSEENHRELAVLAIELHKKGCYVIVTMPSIQLSYDLYGDVFGYSLPIEVRRNISCDSDCRKATEVIFSNT